MFRRSDEEYTPPALEDKTQRGAADREVRTGKPRPVRMLEQAETCAGHAGIQVTAELYGRSGRHAAAQIDHDGASLPVEYS